MIILTFIIFNFVKIRLYEIKCLILSAIILNNVKNRL